MRWRGRALVLLKQQVYPVILSGAKNDLMPSRSDISIFWHFLVLYVSDITNLRTQCPTLALVPKETSPMP